MHRTISERDTPFGELARAKLVRVLGPEHGARVFAETLAAMSLAELGTADELYAFAECLVRRGGMIAAVGAMLGVSAVMRGAAGQR